VNSKTLPRRFAPRSTVSGFSLVELMVAVTIGLFMSAALGAVFINSKSAFSSQDQLAQLQDNERLAMTLLTSSIELAGYFPTPDLTTKLLQLPGSTSLPAPLGAIQFAANAGVVGGNGGAGVGEVMATRYAVVANDSQTSCLGDVAPGAAPTSFVNVFSVGTSGTDSYLQCAVNGGTPVPLVSGVQSFTVLYGVDVGGTGSATQYMAYGVMTPALWALAKTAQVTIQFKNPYFGQPGQPQLIPWVTTVSLMNSGL
jgi:type IV pilus assembly protein PilW